MPAFGQQPSCAYPESLVLIETLPLCRILSSEWSGEDVSDDLPLSDEEVEAMVAPERSLRRAVIMPCADAFALLEEVGHVGW